MTPWIDSVESGVYFGYASLALPPTHPDHQQHHSATSRGSESNSNSNSNSGEEEEDNSKKKKTTWHVYPMVMSIGYNPFYGNRVRSAEVHVLRRFSADFYGCPLRLLVLGFVRPERGDYDGVAALVADIHCDCAVARRSLDRPAWTPRQGVAFTPASAPAPAPGDDGEGEGGAGPKAGAREQQPEREEVKTGTLDGSWLVRDEDWMTRTRSEVSESER